MQTRISAESIVCRTAGTQAVWRTGVAGFALVVASLTLLVAGCGDGGAARIPVPGEPPGFETLEPAVQQQFHRLARALAGDRPSPGLPDAPGGVWGDLGRWFHVYRYPDAAVDCYREAARLDPDEPRWPYYLGLLESEAGRLDAALAAFEEAARRAPDSPLPELRLAELMQKRRDSAGAEFHYQRALDLAPGARDARVGLARLHLQRGDAAAALEALQPLVKRDLAHPATDYLLAQVYRALGDAERARRHLDRLPADRDEAGNDIDDAWLNELSEFNLSSNRLTRIAQRAYGRGDFATAAAYSGRAVSLNPDRPELLANHAAALLALGRIGPAMHQADRALEQDQGLARAHMIKGSIHLRAGNLPAARDALARAVALDPDLGGARQRLGRVYQQLGRRDLAIEQYAALREQLAENPEVRFWHAALLAASGRSPEALAALEDDLAAVPDNPALALLRIRVLAAADVADLRDPARAEELLDAVSPEVIDVYFAETAAMVAAAGGRYDAAVEWQRRALGTLESLPDGANVRIARRRLTLYLERKPPLSPWERGESLVVKPLSDTLPEQQA